MEDEQHRINGRPDQARNAVQTVLEKVSRLVFFSRLGFDEDAKNQCQLPRHEGRGL